MILVYNIKALTHQPWNTAQLSAELTISPDSLVNLNGSIREHRPFWNNQRLDRVTLQGQVTSFRQFECFCTSDIWKDMYESTLRWIYIHNIRARNWLVEFHHEGNHCAGMRWRWSLQSYVCSSTRKYPSWLVVCCRWCYLAHKGVVCRCINMSLIYIMGIRLPDI